MHTVCSSPIFLDFGVVCHWFSVHCQSAFSSCCALPFAALKLHFFSLFGVLIRHLAIPLVLGFQVDVIGERGCEVSMVIGSIAWLDSDGEGEKRLLVWLDDSCKRRICKAWCSPGRWSNDDISLATGQPMVVLCTCDLASNPIEFRPAGSEHLLWMALLNFHGYIHETNCWISWFCWTITRQ